MRGQGSSGSAAGGQPAPQPVQPEPPSERADRAESERRWNRYRGGPGGGPGGGGGGPDGDPDPDRDPLGWPLDGQAALAPRAQPAQQKNRLRPLTTKQMSEPTIYDGTKTKFAEWRNIFHAYLGAHDLNYLHLLLWLEDLGRRAMKPEDLEHLAEDLRLDVGDIMDAKTVLYTLLAK